MSIFQSTTFLSSVQTDVDTAKAIARKIFEAYDKDHSTAIENYEISPLLQDLYRSMNKSFTPSQSDVDGYSKVLDRNGDGKVTLQDIENLCIKYLVNQSTLSKSQVVSYGISPGGYLHDHGETVKKSGYGGYGLDQYSTSGLGGSGLAGSGVGTRTYEVNIGGSHHGGEYAKKSGNLSSSGYLGTTDAHLSTSGVGYGTTTTTQGTGSQIKLLRRTQLEEVRRIFDRFDADRSGFIDQKEIKTLMEETYKILGVSKTITSDDVSSYLYLVDSNRDGKVSPQEYEQIVIRSLERIGIIFE